MAWLNWVAAGFLGIAGIVSAARYSKSKNSGQLFVAGAFLLAGAIFTYVAIKSATP